MASTDTFRVLNSIEVNSDGCLERGGHYELCLGRPPGARKHPSVFHMGWDTLFMRADSSVDQYFLHKCSDAESSLKPYALWLRGSYATGD